MPLLQRVDATWTLVTALIVYFMHGGFGFFEAGMCRKKNTVSTLTHNVVILVITVIVYWLFGFALMYGQGNVVFGTHGFAVDWDTDIHLFPSLVDKQVTLVAALAFAMAFADTPATLIAGSGAERLRLGAVIVLSVLVSGFVFPITARWTLADGWLTRLPSPVYDTGAGSLQLCGGACALAVAWLIGPRRGRFDDGDDRAFGVSSMPMVFLGAFVLWLGFFGFNAGFSMRMGEGTALIVANTALGASVGAITAFAGSKILTGSAELRATIIGLLTANVAVCSAAAVVPVWAAAVTGFVAGACTLGSIRLWAWLRIDDPTEYITMNLVGGAIGMLAVGFFACPDIVRAHDVHPAPSPGVIYGHIAQLESQTFGAAVIAGATFVPVALAAWTLRTLGLLRAEPKDEEEGADVNDHGETAGGAAREPQP